MERSGRGGKTAREGVQGPSEDTPRMAVSRPGIQQAVSRMASAEPS